MEKKTDSASRERDIQPPRHARKPYEKPLLTDYGTVPS